MAAIIAQITRQKRKIFFCFPLRNFNFKILYSTTKNFLDVIEILEKNYPTNQQGTSKKTNN
jgi:FMN-dependent NADH-azoreductase